MRMSIFIRVVAILVLVATLMLLASTRMDFVYAGF